MKALVTGAAGFVGSHLSESLLAAGHEVVGLDSFAPYYDRAEKEHNLEVACASPRFELVEADLTVVDLPPLLRGVDVVFHQAAQPGVRLSWATDFSTYVAANVLGTQRLLQACRTASVARFVNASSSSVYGNRPAYPTLESEATAPHSPYGVTKLAAEHLASAYGRNFGLPTVSLRYFTVYGPRQRPDMATRRFIASAMTGAPVRLFGDGSHVRDFTYVGDVVAANLAAAAADVTPGEVLNIAGGGSTTVKALLDLVGATVGRPVVLDHQPEQPGDVLRTGGDTSRAAALLDWKPQVDLPSGIAAQVAWQAGRPAHEPGSD